MYLNKKHACDACLHGQTVIDLTHSRYQRRYARLSKGKRLHQSIKAE